MGKRGFWSFCREKKHVVEAVGAIQKLSEARKAEWECPPAWAVEQVDAPPAAAASTAAPESSAAAAAPAARSAGAAAGLQQAFGPSFSAAVAASSGSLGAGSAGGAGASASAMSLGGPPGAKKVVVARFDVHQFCTQRARLCSGRI